MANDLKIEGVSFDNGTAEGFDPSQLSDNYIHFVRTSEDKEQGYIYFNGKKYGNVKTIDAGEYPDNTQNSL